LASKIPGVSQKKTSSRRFNAKKEILIVLAAPPIIATSLPAIGEGIV
jgi:hypothetical protein